MIRIRTRLRGPRVLRDVPQGGEPGQGLFKRFINDLPQWICNNSAETVILYSRIFQYFTVNHTFPQFFIGYGRVGCHTLHATIYEVLRIDFLRVIYKFYLKVKNLKNLARNITFCTRVSHCWVSIQLNFISPKRSYKLKKKGCAHHY